MNFARTNDSNDASVVRSTLYAQGTFKNVYRGTYTSGSRSGQACVVKEFKRSGDIEQSYFDEELEVCAATQHIIDAFNNRGCINRTIYLNTPEIWTYRESGQKCLVEPMIENFEKFNSNSGWVNSEGREWGEVMQALSHFSYDFHHGEKLFCDVQGGVYSDGFVVSDPVIMTIGGGFGPADMGLAGIRSFFARHQCNRFCNRGWRRPANRGERLLPAARGTTMMPVATRHSRNPMTRHG